MGYVLSMRAGKGKGGAVNSSRYLESLRPLGTACGVVVVRLVITRGKTYGPYYYYRAKGRRRRVGKEQYLGHESSPRVQAFLLARMREQAESEGA